MAVSELQVETLRAFLTRDFDRGRHLMSQIGEEGLRKGYFPLVTAAFIDAAELRFRGHRHGDIERWVEETRLERDPDGQIDPAVAVRLLLWAIRMGSLGDIDPAVSDAHQALLLLFLVYEQQYSDAELDQFLRDARETADGAMERTHGA